MKKIQKMIALITTVVVILSCFSIASFAKDDPLKFVVLGDSITWGDGIRNSEDACYAKIVANTNGYAYANHAVNGSTSARLLNHLKDEDVVSDIKSADIINISIGGNDFLMQNLPQLIIKVAMGNYEDVDNITKTLAENYAKVIETIKAINPDVTIIAQTLYNPRIDALRKIYGVAVDSVNDTIFAYAEQNPGSIQIMDLRPVFEGHFDYVAADTIHPSASGNVAIATLMLKTLNDLGLGENTQPVVNTAGIDKLPYSSEILGFFWNILMWIKSSISSVFSSVL